MALESQEFILFWSKSNAKVLGFSSLKWLKIPDSGEKLPFPLYLSQFRSPLKTRCNKKRRFSWRKEQERKPMIIISPIRYKSHRHYQPHPLLSQTRKIIEQVLKVICGTISPTPPSSKSYACRHFRSIILMLAISQRMRMICYEPEKNPRWQETATERWSSQTFR